MRQTWRKWPSDRRQWRQWDGDWEDWYWWYGGPEDWCRDWGYGCEDLDYDDLDDSTLIPHVQPRAPTATAKQSTAGEAGYTRSYV